MKFFHSLKKWSPNTRKPLIVVALFVVAVVLAGASGCSLGSNKQPDPVTLEYWRINFDDPAVINQLIANYKATHPYATINQRTFSLGEYQNAIISALAKGQGPDIISISNGWLAEFKQYLQPVPQGAGIPEGETFYNILSFNNDFVDVATTDLTDQGLVYAVPLYVDTLAMYYNKDIFNDAGIPNPPTTWEELNNDARTITKLDAQGNIILPAVSLGTADNVNRSPDILALMMLQNGTSIVDKDNRTVTFNEEISKDGQPFRPGLNALQYYTSFSEPDKSVYSWDLSFDYNIDQFTEGNLGMLFNYSYQRDIIKKKSPNLNFDIAPMLQITEGKNVTNYANYFAEAVTLQSKNSAEAWKFLHYLGSKEAVSYYNQQTNTPTSRRDLIANQLNNPDLAVFAKQLLTATDWYKPNQAISEKIFAKMIQQIVLGEADTATALSTAQTLLNAEVNNVRKEDKTASDAATAAEAAAKSKK